MKSRLSILFLSTLTACLPATDMGNLSTLVTFRTSCRTLSYLVLERSQGIPTEVGVEGCNQKYLFKRRLHQRFGIRITRKSTWVLQETLPGKQLPKPYEPPPIDEVYPQEY